MRKSPTPITSAEEVRTSLTIDIIGDNKYKVTQKRTGVVLTQRKSTTHHKYGKDMTYITVGWTNDITKTYCTTSFARLLWLYYNGDIPDGYQVDHIDDDPSNNRLFPRSNLQLLSQEQNLQKKDIGRNQYTAGWSIEDIIALRQARSHTRNARTEVRRRKKQLTADAKKYMAQIAEYEYKLKEQKKEWHNCLTLYRDSGDEQWQEKARESRLASLETTAELAKAKSLLKTTNAYIKKSIKDILRETENEVE